MTLHTHQLIVGAILATTGALMLAYAKARPAHRGGPVRFGGLCNLAGGALWIASAGADATPERVQVLLSSLRALSFDAAIAYLCFLITRSVGKKHPRIESTISTGIYVMPLMPIAQGIVCAIFFPQPALDTYAPGTAELLVPRVRSLAEAFYLSLITFVFLTEALSQPHRRLLVNNAGMLVMGVTEAFTPEQVARCFDTNVLGVVRCNRAVLPHMRERRSGLIVYVGSVTSCVVSPFQGPYVAAKAAEDKIAETTHYEVSRYGIDSAIVQPGAYTSGTNHFPNAVRPEGAERAAAYDLIAELPGQLAGRLGSLVMPHKREEAQDVADAILRLVDAPAGSRPFRTVVDPQSHGAEPINAVAEEMQREFMERLGIEDLRRVSVGGQAPAGAPDRVV